jgi:hypothetical protein
MEALVLLQPTTLNIFQIEKKNGVLERLRVALSFLPVQLKYAVGILIVTLPLSTGIFTTSNLIELIKAVGGRAVWLHSILNHSSL